MAEETNSGFWLSPQQKHLWLAHPDGETPNAVLLALLEGPLNPDRLRQAWSEIMSRHEVLRSVFRRMPGMKVPFQIVLPAGEALWETTGFENLDEAAWSLQLENLVGQERNRRFDLNAGPLVHVWLAGLASNRWALILSLPALSSDSYSLGILAEELFSSYCGSEEPSEEQLRYVQFAQWQNDLLESGGEGDEQLAKKFWSRFQSAELAAPALPQEAEGSGSCEIARLSTTLASSVVSRFQSISDKHGSSDAHLMLAAWQVLLWRISGQPDFVTGMLSSGREYEELKNAPGLIAKTLPIPARFDGDYRFEEVLQHVRDAAREAAEWQEHFNPDGGQGAADSVNFEYLELPAEKAYGELKLSVLRQEASTTRFKLKMAVLRQGDRLSLEFRYDSSRLSRELVERWSDCFQTLLAAAVENPAMLAGRLPLLTAEQRHRLLLGWNETAAEYPALQCVHELFEHHAASSPDRVAVRSQDRQLTYRELNEQANRLAHALRRAGVGADSLVGLCVDRSVEMIVAVLGIMKAGGAYVPVSPDHPKPRLAQQLAGAAALVTEAQFLDQMPEFGGRVICMDRDRSLWSQEAPTNPELRTTPENLVYVIYTSGSTGVPKGVAVRHRNLVNYAWFIGQRLELQKYPEGLHFATVSTLTADLGNTCVYPSLISGGCLHVIPHEVATDSQRMAAYTSQCPVDVLKIVPSHLAALLDSVEGRQVLPRKYLVMGGEALTPRMLERLAALEAPCEVVNHYGPTETTVGSLTLRLKEYDRSAAASIPIGRPIANTQVYILDAQLQPVPVGVIGELYIAGAGVTAGYIGQPDRTAERFLKNPFRQEPDATMYRTGDMARYLADGNVEFLGRADDQVKIRGFRIELGEIESALAQHPGLKQALVLAREDASGDKRLVGYVVPKPGQDLATSDLRAYLKDKLPAYMIPAAFAKLTSIPLNANGKVNRSALPEPEVAQAKRESIQAPRDEHEAALLKIWIELLGINTISVTDSFFDLGGHSLLAVRLISEIRRITGKEIPPTVLFQGATIEQLAKFLHDEEVVVPANQVVTEVQRGSGPVFFGVVEPGANSLGYITLAKHLGPQQPVYTLRGLGPKREDRPYSNQEYEELSAGYIQGLRTVQPHGPYYLGGMCEGAIIAYTVAKQLENAGEKVELLFIIDAWARENTRNPLLYKFTKYQNALRKVRGLSSPERRRALENALRNRLRWLVSGKEESQRVLDDVYWPGKDFAPTKINARIVVFKAPQQYFGYINDELMGWGERTTAHVEVQLVPGSKHRFLLREPFVRQIASALVKDLERTAGEQAGAATEVAVP